MPSMPFTAGSSELSLAHYAAALFPYMREFSVTFNNKVDFICMDDKQHIKVGEPGNPVAAVDRGRRVL